MKSMWGRKSSVSVEPGPPEASSAEPANFELSPSATAGVPPSPSKADAGNRSGRRKSSAVTMGSQLLPDTVKVKVIKAENLIAKDKGGTSDPFAEVPPSLLPLLPMPGVHQVGGGSKHEAIHHERGQQCKALTWLTCSCNS